MYVDIGALFEDFLKGQISQQSSPIYSNKVGHNIYYNPCINRFI